MRCEFDIYKTQKKTIIVYLLSIIVMSGLSETVFQRNHLRMLWYWLRDYFIL